MKYSSTDRPSRKFDLMGRAMMSPFGLATRPRMAAIWRIWVMLPRAPELTITKIGLVCEKLSFIASVSSAVASVHSSINSWRRSSSVTEPRSYRVSIFAALAS